MIFFFYIFNLSVGNVSMLLFKYMVVHPPVWGIGYYVHSIKSAGRLTQ